MPGNKIKNYFIKKMMEISISTSESIIVPSNYAKISFVQRININQNKINVINLGADHISIKKNINDKLMNFNYNEKYILSVISCVKYHNILNLLKSYKAFLNKTNHNIKFVLVITILDKTYFENLKNYVKDNFKKDQIIFLPNLENKYLTNIYKNSSLYIFSSYSETFGLTSLEAMHFGIPLLLSKTSSINEINGDIPEYFDPDNIDEIKNKLVKIFNLKERYIQSDFEILKKNKHLKKYLWKNTFNNTYKILEKLIT
jgi:glycosyltransferase involved in cell wall biosynthesis